MAITTYTELQTSVANWLNRDDLTDKIPDFITLAEASFDREIRHWRMEKRANAAIDGRFTALPADFLEVVRFHLTADERVLDLVTPLSLQKKRFQAANATGTPQCFSIISGSFEVYPTPDASHTGQIYYYAKTTPLSSTVASNWVLEHFPDTYLYGTLIHSAPYLIDDARLATWSALYQSAISGINANNDKAKFGGSGLRMDINSYS